MFSTRNTRSSSVRQCTKSYGETGPAEPATAARTGRALCCSWLTSHRGTPGAPGRWPMPGGAGPHPGGPARSRDRSPSCASSSAAPGTVAVPRSSLRLDRTASRADPWRADRPDLTISARRLGTGVASRSGCPAPPRGGCTVGHRDQHPRREIQGKGLRHGCRPSALGMRFESHNPRARSPPGDLPGPDCALAYSETCRHTAGDRQRPTGHGRAVPGLAFGIGSFARTSILPRLNSMTWRRPPNSWLPTSATSFRLMFRDVRGTMTAGRLAPGSKRRQSPPGGQCCGGIANNSEPADWSGAG